MQISNRKLSLLRMPLYIIIMLTHDNGAGEELEKDDN